MVCKYGNNGFWNSRIAVEGGFSIMVDYSLYEEKKFNKFENEASRLMLRINVL